MLGSPQVVVVSKATKKQALAEAYIEEVIFNPGLRTGGSHSTTFR